MALATPRVRAPSSSSCETSTIVHVAPGTSPLMITLPNSASASNSAARFSSSGAASSSASISPSSAGPNSMATNSELPNGVSSSANPPLCGCTCCSSLLSYDVSSSSTPISIASSTPGPGPPSLPPYSSPLPLPSAFSMPRALAPQSALHGPLVPAFSNTGCTYSSTQPPSHSRTCGVCKSCRSASARTSSGS